MRGSADGALRSQVLSVLGAPAWDVHLEIEWNGRGSETQPDELHTRLLDLSLLIGDAAISAPDAPGDTA